MGKLCAADVYPRMFKMKRNDGEGEGIWLRQDQISLMTYDEMQGLEEVKVQPSWCLIECVIEVGSKISSGAQLNSA